jgi:hypothetical protein
VRLDQVSVDLQKLGDRLFKLVQHLTGAPPEWQPGSGWYRVDSDHGVFLYFYFLGKRGGRYPPNSVHLAAKWRGGFSDLPVEQGNNWFGSERSADLSARPNRPDEIALAEKFIRRAFDLRGRS